MFYRTMRIADRSSEVAISEVWVLRRPKTFVGLQKAVAIALPLATGLRNRPLAYNF